jgi:hypothetical protein
MYAVYNNNTEMVRLLLDKGANIEAADKVSPAFDHIEYAARFLFFAWKFPLRSVSQTLLCAILL